MTLDDGVRAAAEYGLPAHHETGTVADLEQMIRDGHRILVGLDCQSTTNDGQSTDPPGHCVVVTGIDETRGVVYVSDSSTAGATGHEQSVPLSDFDAAWAATGHDMVVTDGAPDAELGTGVHGDASDPRGLHGWFFQGPSDANAAILPFSVDGHHVRSDAKV